MPCMSSVTGELIIWVRLAVRQFESTKPESEFTGGTRQVRPRTTLSSLCATSFWCKCKCKCADGYAFTWMDREWVWSGLEGQRLLLHTLPQSPITDTGALSPTPGPHHRHQSPITRAKTPIHRYTDTPIKPKWKHWIMPTNWSCFESLPYCLG